tara:strand:+ start:47 stop:301 length:255 start_codon:yes stop_codon:yes gene_type:complete
MDKIKIALFHNSYKDKDTKPDFTNKSVEVNGETYDAAGWRNTDKNGNEMISITLSEPYNPNGMAATPPAPTAIKKANEEGDLPF